MFSRRLFEEGVFGTAIAFPTVALGKARIRVMISAAHSRSDPIKGWRFSATLDVSWVLPEAVGKWPRGQPM